MTPFIMVVTSRVIIIFSGVIIIEFFYGHYNKNYFFQVAVMALYKQATSPPPQRALKVILVQL